MICWISSGNQIFCRTSSCANATLNQMKEKLLQVLILQNRDHILSSGCPLDQVSGLFRSVKRALFTILRQRSNSRDFFSRVLVNIINVFNFGESFCFKILIFGN